MSTVIPFQINGIEREIKRPSKTYKIDFNAGRIVGMTDGIEALKQSIRKALITPRFMCLVYDSQYGSEIKQTISAEDASEAFIQAEIPWMLKDALLVDERILDVYHITYDFSGDKDAVSISFFVDTIYGELEIKEVKIDAGR